MRIITGDRETCAVLAARQFKELLDAKPDAVLGLATGSTPLELYAELIRLNKAGEISFRDAATFNLDEYVGLAGDHPQSYRYFMDTHLFNHIDIDKTRTFVPSGDTRDDMQAALYDQQIAAAGGIDLQLLGLGNNGHIGFNEPGTAIDSQTHITHLAPSTIAANRRFFDRAEDVPRRAVTMGVKSVMNARAIILMAFGTGKAQVIYDAVRGRVTPQLPASILQLHPCVTVYLDEDAAALL